LEEATEEGKARTVTVAIKRTGEGKYQIQWYDTAGHFRKRTYRGITRELAERYERKILQERDAGGEFYDPRRAPEFTVAAQAWIDAYKARWKASTLKEWTSIISIHLDPAWGAKRVSAITEHDGHELIARLKSVGHLGPHRIAMALGVAKAVLTYAVSRKWLREHPLVNVKGLPKPRTDVDPLGPPELKKVLDALPTFWRPWFTVSAWTGMRPSEQAAVTSGDLSLATGTLRVKAGLNAGVLSTPKTASSVRDVDLLPPVIEAIQQQRATVAALKLRLGLTGEPEHDWLFRTEQGNPVSLDSIRDHVWLPALKRAGLRRRPLYQLRHSFASNALAAGESPAWVSKMLGHSTLAMVFQVYGRYIPSTTRRDGSALLRYLTTGEP
jgi:integrase